MNPAERNYPAHDKELLAIMHACPCEMESLPAWMTLHDLFRPCHLDPSEEPTELKCQTGKMVRQDARF